MTHKKQIRSYLRMVYLSDTGLSIIHCLQNVLGENELQVLTSFSFVTF